MKILGILIIAAGFLLFAQSQIVPSIICLLMGAIFLGKPKKQDPETSPDVHPDSEVVRVSAPLQKVRNVHTDHRRLAFPVDGVEKNNDDGSSRQNILQKLCEGEDMAVAEVWFDDFLFDGKLQIRVMTDSGCVGQIRQKDVLTVKEYFGKEVRMIYLEISSSPTNNENREYHADVVIIEDTSSGEKDET